MKLIDFNRVRQFADLRSKMNAELIQWEPDVFWEDRISNDVDYKIDIGEYAVTNLDELSVARDGTLRHKNKVVLVYIPYGTNYKFHFSDCTTLNTMKIHGRYDRYILTRRTDGKFKISNQYGGHFLYELSACKYCLGNMGYSTSDYSAKNFDISKFLNTYNENSKITIPRYTDSDEVNDNYTSEFTVIAKRIKHRSNYTCSKCGQILQDRAHRKFLHVHHINGVKQDNDLSNLSVLCIRCHTEQFQHSHLKNSPQFKEYCKLFPVKPRQV